MYTNKSIRLHSRCLGYLELIQKAEARLDNAATRMEHFDGSKDCYSPLRLMYRRVEIEDDLTRYQELSDWLVQRYKIVMDSLSAETSKRIPAPLAIAV